MVSAGPGPVCSQDEGLAGTGSGRVGPPGGQVQDLQLESPGASGDLGPCRIQSGGWAGSRIERTISLSVREAPSPASALPRCCGDTGRVIRGQS